MSTSIYVEDNHWECSGVGTPFPHFFLAGNSIFSLHTIRSTLVHAWTYSSLWLTDNNNFFVKSIKDGHCSQSNSRVL